MPIQIKKDPYLWAFAGVLVVCAFAAVLTGHATFKEATAFIVGALAMPSIFGSKDKSNRPPPSSGGGDPYRTMPSTPPGDPPPAPPQRRALIPRPLPFMARAPHGFLLLVLHCQIAMACGASSPELEAPLSYDAQQKACIDRYSTREAIDACRNRVRAAWANDASAPDAIAIADAGGDR